MDAIDVTALRQLLIQHCDAVWVGLNMSPHGSHLAISSSGYSNVRHSMSSLGLRPAQSAVPIKRGTRINLRQLVCKASRQACLVIGRHLYSKKCMQLLLRFRIGCHCLPKGVLQRLLVKAQALGPKVRRLKRVCRLYTTGTTGDKKQLLFECSESQKS